MQHERFQILLPIPSTLSLKKYLNPLRIQEKQPDIRFLPNFALNPDQESNKDCQKNYTLASVLHQI